jgi:hypothetical protein
MSQDVFVFGAPSLSNVLVCDARNIQQVFHGI